MAGILRARNHSSTHRGLNEWSTFCKQHFQMKFKDAYYLEWKVCYWGSNRKWYILSQHLFKYWTTPKQANLCQKFQSSFYLNRHIFVQEMRFKKPSVINDQFAMASLYKKIVPRRHHIASWNSIFVQITAYCLTTPGFYLAPMFYIYLNKV